MSCVVKLTSMEMFDVLEILTANVVAERKEPTL